ncbi:MAG: TlpA family protein disulfide reductase [Verrucomicrobia bacterium]|nr:TlpA family protein disulfide reductase [Verrucomicrobiota bacterium]
MTGVAVQLGNTNRLARLDELEQARLKDPKLSDDEKFQIRAGAVQRGAMLRQAEGMSAVLAEFEKGARALQKDFPKRQEIYGMLMMVASESEGEKSRKIAQELIDSPAPDEIKDAAKALLKKMDALNKPVAIAFAAVDGREVDLAKLKGKVVLIDFWATWCGPCVKELPNVKAAYDKLHEKGFEIVGISFDQQKDKLESFVKREKMAWPQYFDGKGWGNKYGQEFGIQSIPSMWLVDKKGQLRDMNARPSLAEKVEKLLAEKD